MSDSLWPHGLQYTRLPCPSLSPRVCLNSCPLSQWCHPNHLILCSSPSISALNLSQYQGLFQWISSSHQVAKGLELQHPSFQLNIQGWFPLGLTGWISLLFKGFSKVFSSTTVQKHQFSGIQPLWSNTHIHTWLLEKRYLWLYGPLSAKRPSCLRADIYQMCTEPQLLL